MRFRFARAIALALLPTLASAVVAAAEPGEVNIYSYRQPYLINPLLKEFSAETGVKVNVIFAEKGLIERIQAEGHNSPADVLLTVDVGNLTQATAAGHRATGQFAGARGGDPAGLSRRRRGMVRADSPRARGLRLEGAGQAGQHHL